MVTGKLFQNPAVKGKAMKLESAPRIHRGMTIPQMQKRIIKLVADIDEIQGEFSRRELEQDWDLMQDALEAVCKVGGAFLDEADVNRLPMILGRVKKRAA
jgi:hypothetical protein